MDNKYTASEGKMSNFRRKASKIKVSGAGRKKSSTRKIAPKAATSKGRKMSSPVNRRSPAKRSKKRISKRGGGKKSKAASKSKKATSKSKARSNSQAKNAIKRSNTIGRKRNNQIGKRMSKKTKSGDASKPENKFLLRSLEYRLADPPERRQEILKKAIKQYNKETILSHLEHIFKISVFPDNQDKLKEDIEFLRNL